MPCLFNKFNRRQSFKIETFFHIKIGIFFSTNISFIKRGNSPIDRRHSIKIMLS